jgi:hypothetical protein
MLDRWGKSIQVGWAEHEMLWIEAALMLPPEKQTDAFLDIGELTCRGARAVRDKAMDILERRRFAEARAAADRAALKALARSRYIPPVLMPSALRKPSLAQLMGRRA